MVRVWLGLVKVWHIERSGYKISPREKNPFTKVAKIS